MKSISIAKMNKEMKIKLEAITKGNEQRKKANMNLGKEFAQLKDGFKELQHLLKEKEKDLR